MKSPVLLLRVWLVLLEQLTEFRAVGIQPSGCRIRLKPVLQQSLRERKYVGCSSPGRRGAVDDHFAQGASRIAEVPAGARDGTFVVDRQYTGASYPTYSRSLLVQVDPVPLTVATPAESAKRPR